MKPADTTLTKADTVALWHAVNWMDTVPREWRRDGFKDDMDKSVHEDERQKLLQARRALRKVNAIRQAQVEVAKFRNFANCRPAEKLQVQRKTAGGAGA